MSTWVYANECRCLCRSEGSEPQELVAEGCNLPDTDAGN